VSTTPAQNEFDQQAQAALAKVKLDHFAAKPLTIEPFATSKLSWKVTIPEEFDGSVDLDIDDTPVSASGEFQVVPDSNTSYQLRARTLNRSRILGTVVLKEDLAACTAPSDEPVKWIEGIIKQAISTDSSGLYFRPPNPRPWPWPPIPWPPIVTIKDDRMIISLRLGKRGFPNPAIDIDASFALDVIPIPLPAKRRFLAGITPFEYHYHQLAPKDERISADVSVPIYLWLIPGAVIALPIAISMAEDKAHASAAKMINDIVEVLNGWFRRPEVLPPKMDKHDAGFYVNPQGSQRFWINFCPVPPTIVNAP